MDFLNYLLYYLYEDEEIDNSEFELFCVPDEIYYNLTEIQQELPLK